MEIRVQKKSEVKFAIAKSETIFDLDLDQRFVPSKLCEFSTVWVNLVTNENFCIFLFMVKKSKKSVTLYRSVNFRSNFMAPILPENERNICKSLPYLLGQSFFDCFLEELRTK